ncbi:unnamed protein product [Vitrella brassicaformis CCMP3155]|uniref:Apple domain-containing protein n=2 Tax=Vitrella brassicaformis TaxID=1169539 RepID=A0A0G4EW80_VITBC|nr:unnamed protein product [Vitrella brassicaformis CCMP3155]|eukprot:CEM02297.1 unnamed protein product [Vitrella brassicaformis CCMP3155]
MCVQDVKWPDDWVQRPRSCSRYYWDNGIKKKHDELKSACFWSKPTYIGDLVVIDDAYEAQWLADQLRSRNDQNKAYWARLKRTGSYVDEQPKRIPDLGGTAAARDDWSPGGGWQWEGSSRGLWNIAWDGREPYTYGNNDRGIILARGSDYEEPWDLVMQTKEGDQDNNRAMCEKRTPLCVDPPTVMITTQTAFPDAEATVFNITLRFSDAIKDLTFEAPFDELSAWQTVGGVGGAIELVSQPDDHVIEERLWAVQEGQVTVQVKDMVFRRTSDDQANTPSNELIVHSGCGMAWSQGKDIGLISSTSVNDWWKCSRLCREEPSCEIFVFDASYPRPFPCRLYSDADLSGPSDTKTVSSSRSCAIRTDSTPPRVSFVRKLDAAGAMVAGGTFNYHYDDPAHIHVSVDVHISEPVTKIATSDIAILCTNISAESVTLHKQLQAGTSPSTTWPGWDDAFQVEVRMDEAPVGFSTGQAVIALSPSADVTDFSGNAADASAADAITFVLEPACNLMRRLNATLLAGGNLKGLVSADNQTFDTCATECRTVPLCGGFSFHQASGLCHLKWASYIDQPAKWVETPDPAYDSAIRDCQCLTDCIVVTLGAQVCGDGVVVAPETCDDGNTDSGDGCSETCHEETGWQCLTPGEPCYSICGDGLLVRNEPILIDGRVVVPTEECDDGNLFSGDGCSDRCLLEVGWTCPAPGSPCSPVCGDGRVRGQEQCDDSNLINGDGCSSVCEIEPGWTCPIPGSPCSPVCGDGSLRGAEQCDDGNLINGDGCSSDCEIEPGWTCPSPGSPCTLAPVDFDSITDNLDKLRDPGAIDPAEIEDMIGELLNEDSQPTPPPVHSLDEFGRRLVKAIAVASVLSSADNANISASVAALNGTERKRVVNALLRRVEVAASERSTRLSEESSSPGEVLLSAVTLTSTIEAADTTESDDIDAAAAGVSALSILANVSASTISTATDGTGKALLGLSHYLDSAAGLFRQLNRSLMCAAGGTHRRLRGEMDSQHQHHDLASQVLASTAQLGDSLAIAASRTAVKEREIASPSRTTSVKVVRKEHAATGATLTINKAETANSSVAVALPSSLDAMIPPGGQCADGSGSNNESVQMVFWTEDPFAYSSAAFEEQTANLSVLANNTLRSAERGTLSVAVRRCGADVNVAKQEGTSTVGEVFRLFIPRPGESQVASLQVNDTAANLTTRVDVACGFWNTTTHQWDTRGCWVNESLSNAATLCCVCTHLTSFSALFRTVIKESNIEGALTESSIKRIADANAWVQNYAAAFVIVMMSIHLLCLAMSLYFDCKYPVTDQILLDIWMTDPLLDAKHRARTRLRKSMRSCYGPCYNSFLCDFLICRFVGGLFFHCRRREPTLHLSELRTIRTVRHDLIAERSTPYLSDVREPLARARTGSHMSSQSGGTGRSAVSNAPMRGFARWLSRQFSMLFSSPQIPKDINVKEERRTTEEYRNRLRKSIPRLIDFIKSTYRRRQAVVMPTSPTASAAAVVSPEQWPKGEPANLQYLGETFTPTTKGMADFTPPQPETRAQPDSNDQDKPGEEQVEQEQQPMPDEGDRDSPASVTRKRIKKPVSLARTGSSDDEDREDPSQVVLPGLSNREAAMDMMDMQAAQGVINAENDRRNKKRPVGSLSTLASTLFSKVLNKTTPKQTVTLIKSGILKEALRKRLLRELQRQQAAAVLIQRTFRRDWQAKIRNANRPTRAISTTTAQDGPRQGSCTSPMGTQPGPIDAGNEPDDGILSSAIDMHLSGIMTEAGQSSYYETQGSTMTVQQGPLHLSMSKIPQPEQTQAQPSAGDVFSPTSSFCAPSEAAMIVFSEPRASPMPAWRPQGDRDGSIGSQSPAARGDGDDESPKVAGPVSIAIGEGDRGRMRRQVTIMEPSSEASSHRDSPRRKPIAELWGDLQAEVDLMVTRTLRRIEYVEWSSGKIFKEVCRRDHPLLKLFILNPTYTATQRTLFFGSITLGIIAMCGMFFNQTQQSQRDTDSVIMSFQSGGISWKFTLRQLVVLLWAIILSKPVPIALFFLFRKTVPHIPFLPDASRITHHPAFGHTTGGRTAMKPMPSESRRMAILTGPQISVKSLRRVADVTGRHSGHFSLDAKIAVLSRWRIKERIGIAIALLYWFACCGFLLLFALSEQLAEGTETRSRHLVYQDFVLACSMEALTEFVIEPLLFFVMLSLLLMMVLRVDAFDWVVWACPQWFDFTFVRAQSLHELTIQLSAMTDTYGLTRGIVGFAGINIDTHVFAAAF